MAKTVDLDALAAQFGGSVVNQEAAEPMSDPNIPAFVTQMPPKMQDEWRQRQYTEGQKRLDELRQKLSQGEGVLSDLERFGQINQKSDTGGWLQKYGPDWNFLQHPGYKQMQSISNSLAPSMRPVGSGSSSDTDVKLFLSGLPSVENYGNDNKAIRENYKRNYDYGMSKQQFLQEYLTKYGHLNGADSAWKAQPQYKAYIQGNSPSAVPQNDFAAAAQAELARRKKK